MATQETQFRLLILFFLTGGQRELNLLNKKAVIYFTHGF